MDIDIIDIRTLGYLSSTSTVVSATTIGNLTAVNQTDGSGDGSGRGPGASSGAGLPGGAGEDSDDDDVDVLSPLSMSFLGVFLSIVIFLSVAGNILVCIAIYTERSLRRIGNLFLASLAIADLFVASLVMTFAGVNDLLGYWIFGAQFCDTWVAFDVMCSTASILNLCAISLDRYIHIKDPLRIRNRSAGRFPTFQRTETDESSYTNVFYRNGTTRLLPQLQTELAAAITKTKKGAFLQFSSCCKSLYLL